MKKLIGITLFLGLTLAVNAQKIGHIALDSLLKNMPESDSARKVGQAYYQQLEMTIESMQKELQTKNDELQTKGATYTAVVKDMKTKELQDLYQRMQAFQQEAQGSLQKFNDSITRPIINKAKKAVNEVAKEHGFKYIIDTSSGIVLYSEDADDVYALVADKLGIKAKGTKGK